MKSPMPRTPFDPARAAARDEPVDADEDFSLDHDYNEEYEREHDSGSDPDGPRDHPRGPQPGRKGRSRRPGGGKPTG